MESMVWAIADAFWNFELFLSRGGTVLYWILLLILVLWIAISERTLFFLYGWQVQEMAIIRRWQQRPERHSWEAHQVRRALLAESAMTLNSLLPLIKTLIALCPLFGLLGTVTGMIEVFDVMAFVGNGSPKAMASGISKATIPTMAGMVGALSGVFAASWLQKKASGSYRSLEEKLTFDQ